MTLESLPPAILYSLLGNHDAAQECARADEAMRLLRSFASRLDADGTAIGRKDREALQIMLARPDQSLSYDDFDFHGISRRTMVSVRRKLLAAGYAHLPNGPRGGLSLTALGREAAKNISPSS
jgi:hypothetical protein